MSEGTRNTDVNRTDGERLAVIETTVLDIKVRLFGGDGQAGELSSLRDRVAKLENWRWYVVGIGVGAGVTIGWIAKSALASVL